MAREEDRGTTRRRSRRLIVAAAGAVVALLVAVVVVVALGSGGDDDPPTRTFVASSGAAPATLWAVGDSADGGRRARRVADLIARQPADRLLYLGDIYERGTAREWNEHYEPAYGRFAKITAPTPGNHEWYLRDDGYRPYWKRKTGRAVPDYYDFRIAGWHVLSLNSEHELEPDSEQARWLAERVRPGGNCRLAFWHRARFTAGSHDDDPKVDTLWRPLAGKAAVVVSAHDHNMQRHRERDGIAQYISGAGGHSNYYLDEEDPDLEFSNDEVDGALRIDLRPGTARMTFVAADGRVLDRSTVRCRT